jgi:hypothetical protein
MMAKIFQTTDLDQELLPKPTPEHVLCKLHKPKDKKGYLKRSPNGQVDWGHSGPAEKKGYEL